MLGAYCWPQSGRPGDVIDLMIGGLPAGHLEGADDDEHRATVVVSRVGDEEVEVARWTGVAVEPRPVPEDAAINGCGWPSTLEIVVEPSWRTGFHLVRVTVGAQTVEAFFVVRAAEPGQALLVLSTSTWAAYNDWGGPSFYTGGHTSSMERPLPRGFLDKPDPARYRVARMGQLPRLEIDGYFAAYSYWSAAAGWANWERLFAAWAERNGLELDYATSLDLANDPELLTPYRCYLSVGHDEYWSASMRDAVEGWVDDGGAAVFLSGNTAFWQVRFEGASDHGPTRVIGYKNDFALDPVMGTDRQHQVSTMWSDPLCGRPENGMTGVSFTRGGYAHCRNAPYGTGGYTVWRPDHWAFDGIRLRAGDVVGAEPVVVGYECDGCELQLIDGLPHPTGTDGTPPGFEVLATAPAHLWATEEGAPGLPDSYIGELNWVAERLAGADTEENRRRFATGSAVLGTYRRGAGEVFTVGCTDWAYGLDDPTVSRITGNVIGRFVELPCP